jgi:hypothetical protein
MPISRTRSGISRSDAFRASGPSKTLAISFFSFFPLQPFDIPRNHQRKAWRIQENPWKKQENPWKKKGKKRKSLEAFRRFRSRAARASPERRDCLGEATAPFAAYRAL